MRLVLSLLPALLLAVTPARKPQVFQRVMANGMPVPVQRPTLNLTGPFQCSDNSVSTGGGSLDCACPNTGVVAQGMVQFTLSSVGQVDVPAPWVTANTFPVCMPIGGIPMRVTLVPDSIKPGIGFSIFVWAPDVTVGNFNVGCIGAVPQ